MPKKKLPRGFPWMGTFDLPCIAVFCGEFGEWAQIAVTRVITVEQFKRRLRAQAREIDRLTQTVRAT